jgi:hypothetical protein
LYLSLHKFGWRALRKPILWGYAVIVFVPLYLWYSHAHSVYLASGLTFGIWDYGQGKWGNWGSLATLKFYNDVFFKSIAERHLTYAGFVLFVVGLFIPRKNDRERLFDWWLIAILAYFCIVTTGNQVHEYYQLPFTLPAAVFMAKSLNACLSPGATKQEKGLPLIVKYVIYLALAVLPILGFIRYYHYMIGEQIDGAIFRLESAVKENIQHDSLVVAVDEGDPVILYRCGKKGWHSSPEELAKGNLEELHKKGAGYLVGLKTYFDSDSRIERLRLVLKQFRIVKQTDDYLILDLNSPLIL